MTEFYVDPEGLNGLYNHLVRASEDATQTVAYAQKHCDLDITAEGLLMVMLGPHGKAYDNLVGAVRKLGELAQATGTQINRAQKDYARTDSASAARVDAAYAGAKDPAGLRGTTAPAGRPDLYPAAARAAFADVAEPTAALTDPNYATPVEMWSINPLTDLVSPSAWLRQVSIWLFDHDPFEGWVKQFSGDWNAYVHCGVAWGHIGSACFDVGRNLTASTPDVATVWRGNAAEGEQEYQLKLGGAAMKLKGVCAEYNDTYVKAADQTKKLFTTVSSLISQLIDILIIINAAAAIGTATIETVIGPIVGYGIAAFYIWQAIELYQQISAVYGAAEAVISTLAGTIGSIEAKLSIDDLPTAEPYRHPAGY